MCVPGLIRSREPRLVRLHHAQLLLAQCPPQWGMTRGRPFQLRPIVLLPADHHQQQQQECGAEDQRVKQQQQQQEDPAPAAAGRAAVDGSGHDRPPGPAGQPGPPSAGGDSAQQAAAGDQDLTAGAAAPAAQAASALALQQPEQHGFSLHPGQQHPYSAPGGPNHQAQLDGANLQRQLLMQQQQVLQQQQQRRLPRVVLDEFNPDLLPKGVQRDLALLQVCWWGAQRARAAEAWAGCCMHA